MIKSHLKGIIRKHEKKIIVYILTRDKMRKYYGEIGLIITAVIWGSGFVATAISLENYTAYQSMAIRFLVASLFLLAIYHRKLKHINKKILINGIILGTILYTAFALQTVGLIYTTPSKNAFLTAVNVVIVPIILFVFYKRQLDRYEIIGAFLAVFGIGLLSLQFSGVINLGDFLSFLCAIGFAFHIIYTAKFVRNSDAILLTLIQLITAAVIGFIILVFKNEMVMTYEPKPFFSVIYLGLFSTCLAYVLQTSAQKLLSETKAAIILSTEALWGMIFSIIILHEIITFRMMAGAVLIFSAILIAEVKQNLFKFRLERR